MDEEVFETIVMNELDEDAIVDRMVQDLLTSSDEEPIQWGGSRKGKAPNKMRNFAGAYAKVVADYFSGPNSVYDERDFERRFRMPRVMFNRIHDAVMGKDPFVQYKNALGELGIHPLCKLVACLRYLAYGDAYDREDENLRIAQGTLNPIVRAFNKLIIQQFGPTYLNRWPNEEERREISREMGTRDFPGCLASWDCKHFTWSSCPMRWHGQHQGHSEGGKKTLILEAIADHRKYLWAVNFGNAGSLNDINVLDRSSIVGSMLTGGLSLKTEPYVLNGNERDWHYFLVDGIYPEWAIFVNTFSSPNDNKKKLFAQRQESVRKDIECAFGIVVQRFHVLKRPLSGWYVEDLRDLIHCCVIFHNMIVVARFGTVGEEARDAQTGRFALFGRREISLEEAAADGIDLFSARSASFDISMQSCFDHYKLKKDLVEHIHSKYND